MSLTVPKSFLFQNKKLSNHILGYEANPARFSHDPNKVILNFSWHVLTKDEKSLLYKEPRFSMSPKKIDQADFLTQFELLYVMSEMRSKNCNLLKTN